MDQYRQSSPLQQKIYEAKNIVALCSIPLIGVLIWIGYNNLTMDDSAPPKPEPEPELKPPSPQVLLPLPLKPLNN